ncbi:hypothetical protein BDZ91DRAFT_764330 [Kalaharituber pfeilii]|nr:hypothetical protein BDZ91DRAFT_764330 [Kalaharituber pfeilii]
MFLIPLSALADFHCAAQMPPLRYHLSTAYFRLPILRSSLQALQKAGNRSLHSNLREQSMARGSISYQWAFILFCAPPAKTEQGGMRTGGCRPWMNGWMDG